MNPQTWNLLALLAMFVAGYLVGAVQGKREQARLRNSVRWWMLKAQDKTCKPESRVVTQRPLTERLNMVDEEEAKAAREAWGDQVQAEEFLAEIDRDWEESR